MTTSHTKPRARWPITLNLAGRKIRVRGEATDLDAFMVIREIIATPTRTHRTGMWTLMHVPSSTMLPVAAPYHRAGQLHMCAEELATINVDWCEVTPDELRHPVYQREARQYQQAIQVTRAALARPVTT